MINIKPSKIDELALAVRNTRRRIEVCEEMIDVFTSPDLLSQAKTDRQEAYDRLVILNHEIDNLFT